MTAPIKSPEPKPLRSAPPLNRGVNYPKKRMLRSAIILLAAGVAAHSAATDTVEQEAKDFLERFVALGDAHDPALADLYSDGAVIKAHRRYPHGLERTLELTGVQWKALVRTAMPWAKALNDRSELRDPQFEVDQGKVTIRADRYSVRKCYLDTGYYMILERQPDGALGIVEEYTETQPQSDC